MAFAKIELKRDWKSHKQGDVIETSHANAEELVADGSAVYVKGLEKPVKDKMVKGNKTNKK